MLFDRITVATKVFEVRRCAMYGERLDCAYG